MPEPITTEPVFATASSTSTGQRAGRPTGVIPPYSMSVAAVTVSTGANDAFRASRCLRTSPFTSARVVARIMQAAYIVFPPRLPATTTQFAASVGETPYRSQNAAVSASAGSISATRTSSAPGQPRSASATGTASRSVRDNAGTNDSTSLMRPIQPPPAAPSPHPPRLAQSASRGAGALRTLTCPGCGRWTVVHVRAGTTAHRPENGTRCPGPGAPRAAPAPLQPRRGRLSGGKVLGSGGQSGLFFRPVWSRDP